MIPNDFNWRQYIKINKDLKNFNEEEAKSHYIHNGIHEGRIYNLKSIPNDFDHFDYLEFNSDLAELKLDKFECKVHYLTHGKKEGRKYNINDFRHLLPSDFDSIDYIMLNDDLIDMNEKQAILHYINIGKNEGRKYTYENEKEKEDDIKITEFKILGERCTGTNFLEEELTYNFLDLTYRDNDFHKHFFCLYDFELNADITDRVIYIGIVRNAIDWIYSFYNNPHNVDKAITNNINDFTTKEFSSYNFVNNQYVLIYNDLNYINGEKYRNIFECRKIKNDFLLNVMPHSVKHYMLIKYEDLRDNTTQTLNKIKEKFKLEKISNEYTIVKHYKKNKNVTYSRKDNTFDANTKKFIIDNLDIETEKLLGYEY